MMSFGQGGFGIALSQRSLLCFGFMFVEFPHCENMFSSDMVGKLSLGSVVDLN